MLCLCCLEITEEQNIHVINEIYCNEAWLLAEYEDSVLKNA